MMRGSMLPLKKTLSSYDKKAPVELVYRVTTEDYYNNIKSITDLAKKEGCKPIILVTTNEVEYSGKIREFARKNNILLVEGYLSIITRKMDILTSNEFLNLRKTYIKILGEPNLISHREHLLFVRVMNVIEDGPQVAL